MESFTPPQTCSPDPPEYLHVEEDEGGGGHDTGEHQPGPVDVEPAGGRNRW